MEGLRETGPVPAKEMKNPHFMDWNEDALCLGFTRDCRVAEMREAEFSIHSKKHLIVVEENLIWRGFWPYTMLHYRPYANLSVKLQDLLQKIWMQIQAIVSSYPHWYQFFPQTCNVKTMSTIAKWKSICHVRLS